MGIKIAGGSGGSSGALAVPNDLVFANAAARDTFFTNNPARKVVNLDIVVGNVMQRWDGSAFQDMTAIVRGPIGDPATNLVQSVNSKTGTVVLAKGDVGLGNVDNTSDANKPISNAVASALIGKANTSHVHNTGDIFNLDQSLTDLASDITALETGKQDKLVSGTTIKTINGNAVLGSGDIVINAVSDATSSVVGGIKLTGDLAGSANSPSVAKINGVAITTTGITSGKLLKATSGTTASFESVTAADVGAIPTSAKGANDGVAELDANGKLPSARLPAGIVQSVNGNTGVVTLTKASVGLANAENTADLDKPISTLTQNALNLKVNSSLLGQLNGVATLDGNGKIPSSQIAAISTGETFVVANQAARLASSATKGDVAVQTDTNESYILKDTPPSVNGNWIKLLFPATVTSVNTKTGSVTLTKADLSLGNVDNTADLSKPVSTATQTELDKKVDKTVLTAKGELLTHSGTALVKQGVGTDGQVLKYDSTSPTGLKWENLPTAAVVVNNLASDATDSPLSAAQGKTLKTLVDAKPSLSNDNPFVNGAIAQAGTSNLAARADHIHPFSGVAVTAYAAAGDLLVGSDAAAYGKVALGTNGQVLTVDTSVVPTKIKWSTLADASVGATQAFTTNVPHGIGATIINVSPTPTDITAGMIVDCLGYDEKSGSVVSVAGNNITITPALDFPLTTGQTVVITKTVAKSGLMSSADKTKLNGIALGATNTPVVDNLTSSSTSSALSANQGKVLQDGKANLASPTFTGTPAAPTAAVDVNTTQLATTAFVIGQAASVAPSSDAATASAGTSNRYARQDHVHRFPSGLHNGSRQVGTFSGTEHSIQSPTSNKVAVKLTDTSYEVVLDNLQRFWLYNDYTVLRGPSGVESTSSKFHLSDSDIFATVKGKDRLFLGSGNSLLRGPLGGDTDSTRLDLQNALIYLCVQNDNFLQMNKTSGSVKYSLIVGSDQKIKTPLQDFPDSLLDAWGKNVKWGSYQSLQSDDKRNRCGLIAQDVIKAFDEAGLDWKEWAVVNYNEEHDLLMVAYDYANAIENAYQRRRLDKLEALLNSK